MSLESTLADLAPHIKKLADAFEKVQPLLELLHKSQAPAVASTAAVPSSRPAENASAPATPTPAAPPAAAPTQDPKAAAEALLKEAKDLTVQFADANREKAIAILAEFGAKKTSEIATTKLPEFIARVKKALAEHSTLAG